MRTISGPLQLQQKRNHTHEKKALFAISIYQSRRR